MRREMTALLFGIVLLADGVAAERGTLAPPPSGHHIAMVGDSITAGGVWHKLFPNASIVNYGVGGASSEAVLSRLDSILARSPQVVFVMIGINDLASGVALTQIVANIESMVERIAASGATPIVQSTLFVGRDHRLRSNEDVKAINAAVHEWCKERHVTFVDLNKRLAPAGYLGEELTDDGVHLTARAYQMWAEEIRGLVNQVSEQGVR